MLALHRQYGPIVRIAPNELAFSGSRAWKDIYVRRTAGGRGDMDKDMAFYRPLPDGFHPPDIINAHKAEHVVLRREMAQGFSERSLRAQQPIVGRYIDLLITRLHERCAAPVDMTAWYNFTTFDVIGDLTFGEPFGCLETSDYHPWVKKIFAGMKIVYTLQTLGNWPTLKAMLFSIIPRDAMKEHAELTRAKTRKRLELGADRPDLVEELVKEKADFVSRGCDFAASSRR